MSRVVVAIIALVAFVAGAIVGVLGYVTVTGGSGEPSRDVRSVAPTLSLGELGSEPTATPEGGASLGGIRLARNIDKADIAQDVATTEEAPAPDAAEEPIPVDPVPFALGLYRINQELSQARFLIDEDLRGVRITVAGITDQVGGDFIVNFVQPAASQVGGIAINARTLATDSGLRDQAIRGRILRSADDRYEFITFTPTSLDGLDDLEEVLTGQEYTFSIEGELTIIETTRDVVFTATVTIGEGGETLIGTARTEVLYRDFNLTIPNAPGVANISDEVVLEFDFVADLVESRDSAEADATTSDSEVIPYNAALYRVDQEESEARFAIGEDLNGVPIIVVGTTNQVGADFIINYANPAASQLGTVLINARTLATDNSFRNQALRGQILRSADERYEFITFTPTAIESLPAAREFRTGETISFTITGDLTIVETTRPVTFSATVTLVDAETVLIQASTEILYRDFNLSIPSVPGVANITPEVTLEVDFLGRLIDSN